MRASSSCPFTCSGDMYATVPSVLPGLVRCSSLKAVGAAATTEARLGVRGITFARPKSRIFA